MKLSNTKKRLLYAAAFVLLFVTEVIIALFVHDRFVRPYLGDVLAVVTVYCGARIVFVSKQPFLSVWVTDLSERVGSVFAVILGATFDFADLLCYAVGGILAAIWDYWRYRKTDTQTRPNS